MRGQSHQSSDVIMSSTWKKSNQEHDNLVKAITSKNEVHAKAIMEAHIMRSYQDFLQEKSTK